MKHYICLMKRILCRARVLPGVLAVLLLVQQTAASQGDVSSIAITKVDCSDYPEVRLQVAAIDPSGEAVDSLAVANVMVAESIQDQRFEYDVERISSKEVGVRVAFVIDVGDGKLNTGESLASVYDIARPYVQTYVSDQPWMKAGVDETTMIVQAGMESVLVVPMTNDPDAVNSQLSSYETPSDDDFALVPEYGDFTRAALNRAIDELEYSPGGEDKAKVIILFTPGARASLDDVFARALEAKITIHIVLARHSVTSYWSEALRPLAERSGGMFLESYEVPAIGPLYESITRRRTQHLLTYRASSAAKGDRQVILEAHIGAQLLTASAQYCVEPLPPEVKILSPSQGAVIMRRLSEESEDPLSADPMFYIVTAAINWPDGYPRNLGKARMLVDDVSLAQAQVADNRAEFRWDIRSYQSEGKTPAILRVEVEDELGLQGKSPPVTVGVSYIAPQTNTDLGFASNKLDYLLIGLVIISLGLSAFLLVNRSRIAPAIQQASEGIVDFVERVTGRRSELVARAYLMPLEGGDGSSQNAFEIYGTTAIGRSRRYADLLFHIGEEDSPISRLHATILDEDDHFEIRDEDSSNGTYVNNRRLAALEPEPIQDGDIIDLAALERGGIRFVFHLAGSDGNQPDLGEDLRQTRPRRRLEQQK